MFSYYFKSLCTRLVYLLLIHSMYLTNKSLPKSTILSPDIDKNFKTQFEKLNTKEIIFDKPTLVVPNTRERIDLERCYY